MWTTVLLSAVLFTTTEAQVTFLSGEQAIGTVTAVSQESITLRNDTTDQKHSLNQLQSVVFSQNQTASPRAAPITVTLHDGTLLKATSVTLAKSKFSIQLSESWAVDFHPDSIRDIRFKTLTGEALQQYDAIIKGNTAEDILIIQRASGALDQLEGIVEALDAKIVTFNFDGEKIPVEIEKLAGVRLLQPADKKIAASVCRVTDTHNNVWLASDFTLDLTKQQLMIKLGTGDTLQLDSNRLSRFDFSSSNVLYLSDMTPESVQWEPFLTGRLIRNQLAKVYEPRLDKALDGSPLMVGSKSYSKGLSLHSRTVMSLRLPVTFSRLQMDVGIDPAMDNRGHVELIILGDNKQLFQDFVSGTDKPRSLDLNITGIRRITITVDYGKNLDIGDHLNLGNARVLK